MNRFEIHLKMTEKKADAEKTKIAGKFLKA